MPNLDKSLKLVIESMSMCCGAIFSKGIDLLLGRNAVINSCGHVAKLNRGAQNCPHKSAWLHHTTY